MARVPFETLGEAVKFYRQQKRLSLMELSKLVKMSDEGIAKIENGTTKKPGSQTLIKIADALGRDRDEFLSLLPGINVLPYQHGSAAKKEIAEKLEKIEAEIHELIKAVRDI